jgi:hypothetical protein
VLEFWKRKEKLTALKWGMIDFEKDEVSRPGAFLCCAMLCCAVLFVLK